jgi:hypothetical protein
MAAKVNDKALPTFSFSGHETFVFRYGWLKKAYDAVIENPQIFGDDQAIVTLGVGKNMVRSIRHWALATGVLAEEPKTRGTQLCTTPLADFLFGSAGHDPYLEDPNTLWLLHWNLLSNRQRCTTWFWAFYMLSANEFTRDGLMQSLIEEMRRSDVGAPNENTLRRDVEVFVRCYVPARAARGVVVEDSLDCPLAELNLIEEDEGSGSVYRIRRGPKPGLNDRVFAFALADFWERVAPDRESMAFSEIAYATGGPGNGFKLDENSLIERLERLEFLTNGELSYTETAGLKQVYGRPSKDKLGYLTQYYETANPLFVVTA